MSANDAVHLQVIFEAEAEVTPAQAPESESGSEKE